MKKTALLFIAALCCLLLACGGNQPPDSNSISPSAAESTSDILQNSEESSDMTEESLTSHGGDTSMGGGEELKKIPIPEGSTVITNRNYDNGGGKMGDNDGPAYCVYSKIGYNKASMDIAVDKIKINTIRRTDGKFVNAYIFLGCDVYNGAWWANCFDTGLCYSGKNPAWHLFYNIYKPAGDGEATWYESKVKLSPEHSYTLTLDTSLADEMATLTIYDLTLDKIADSVTFSVYGMKADGSNTSYLMDFALDYPPNTKLDTSGNASEDFVEITLYNTDEDLYMQNILVENVKIYKGTDPGVPLVWDDTHTGNRALWPDKNIDRFDYDCTKVITAPGGGYDYSFRVDLDMNRE